MRELSFRHPLERIGDPQISPSFPAFMEKGDTHIGFGIMGGFNQAQAHAQFVSQRGGSRNEHSDRARSAALHEAQVGRLRCADGEARVSKEVREELTAGPCGEGDGRILERMGGGQAVIHDSAKR